MNKFRIEWDCRRGMLELDNIIMPFFKKHFDDLTEKQQETFIELLAQSDLQLFSYFFNNGVVPEALKEIVQLITEKIER